MPTGIEWCQETWNPVTGCTPVSEGCAHCYAERMAKRLAGRYGYPKDDPFAVTLHADRLDQPLHWRKPRLIFVCSMGDLFHDDVFDTFILEVWNRFLEAPQHKYLVLTKRPQRMRDWLRGRPPLPNVWLGVTAENQRTADERVPVLLDIPAAVRFVSCEPLLSPINFREKYSKLGWVIVGGETGPGARRMELDWARWIHDQCIALKIPFFFKHIGGLTKTVGGRLLDGREWNDMPDVVTNLEGLQ